MVETKGWRLGRFLLPALRAFSVLDCRFSRDFQFFNFACSGIFCFTAILFSADFCSDFSEMPANNTQQPTGPASIPSPPPQPDAVFFPLRRPHPLGQLLAASQRGREKGKARVDRRIDKIARHDPMIPLKLEVLNLWRLPVH